MNKPKGALLGLISILLVSGCSVSPFSDYGGASTESAPVVSCNSTVQPEQQLQLDAVDALMAQSKPYAALAQLESKGLDTEHHWARRGQLLASIDRLDEALGVFYELAARCDSYRGYHGLGMVQLKQQKIRAGLIALEKARQMAPSSAAIRNDYGYGLLLNRQFKPAVFELRTALELSGGEGAVRQNLAAAYLLTDDQTGIDFLRKQYSYSDHELAHARRLAREFF